MSEKTKEPGQVVDISRNPKTGEVTVDGISGWMTPPELAWLESQAGKVAPGGTIIEVGSWKGLSSRALAEGRVDDSVQLICIDTFKGTGDEEEHEEARAKQDGVYPEFMENVGGKYPNIRVLRMSSLEGGRLLADEGVKADLVFIDGDHRGEAVAADIRAFLPLVKDGGLLSGHDFTDPRFESLRLAVVEAARPVLVKVVNRTSIWRFHVQGGRIVEDPEAEGKPSVFIGCPSYKGEHPEFLKCLDAVSEMLAGKYRLTYGPIYHDAMVDRARANVFGKYLETGPHDFFLSVDDDITLHPTGWDAILSRMVLSQVHNPGNPKEWLHCVGAPYPFKCDEGGKAGVGVYRPIQGTKAHNEGFMHGLREVRWQGGGWYCVTDFLLKTLMVKHPELHHYNHSEKAERDEKTGFWKPGRETWALWLPMILPQPDWGPGRNEYISEDWAFMERVRQAGFKVYIDEFALCGHWVGDKMYSLNAVEGPLKEDEDGSQLLEHRSPAPVGADASIECHST